MALTRRSALHSAALAVLGLAGCVDRQPTPTTQQTSDPPTAKLRRPQSVGPVVSVSNGGPMARADQGLRDAVRRGIITGSDAAALLELADVEGARTARQVISATDFSSQTLLVDAYAIGQCYERSLCHVDWSRTELSLSYESSLREPSVACDDDATDTVAQFVRIDGRIDPREVRSLQESFQDPPAATYRRESCPTAPPSLRVGPELAASVRRPNVRSDSRVHQPAARLGVRQAGETDD